MFLKIDNNITSELVVKLKRYIYDVLGCCQEVHRELGPYLNEYMYQDALEILFKEKRVEHIREFQFQFSFHGKLIKHFHRADFLCKGNIILECKAAAALNIEYRQQLWNYLRLSNTRIGILYNFAPIKDQCERYYYNPETKTISAF